MQRAIRIRRCLKGSREWCAHPELHSSSTTQNFFCCAAIEQPIKWNNVGLWLVSFARVVVFFQSYCSTQGSGALSSVDAAGWAVCGGRWPSFVTSVSQRKLCRTVAVLHVGSGHVDFRDLFVHLVKPRVSETSPWAVFVSLDFPRRCTGPHTHCVSSSENLLDFGTKVLGTRQHNLQKLLGCRPSGRCGCRNEWKRLRDGHPCSQR